MDTVGAVDDLRFPSFLRTAILIALAGSLAPPVPANDEAPAAPPGLEEISPIPRRFPRFTDANGCVWGVQSDGAVALSGNAASPGPPLFRNAAALSVGDQPFAAAEATGSRDHSQVRLTGKAGDTTVTRDVWIDRERGAVRHADTFYNTTNQPLSLAVRYQFHFDQPVPVLLRGDGSSLPEAAPEVRESILAFVQTQPEGMSSALVIAGDPKTKATQKWRAARNAELHMLDRKVDVPAEGAATLVLWLIQRPSLNEDSVKETVDTFFRGGRLQRPMLDAPAIASLVNFPRRGLSPSSLDDESGAADSLLAALDRFAGRLGIQRGDTDVYYMNPKSLLEGETTGGPLALESRFGSITVPLPDVAAVLGGGGRGRWPRVFLRDGHVLSGAIAMPDWKISGARGWAIALNPETLEAIVLRARDNDGAAEQDPNFILQLTSGDTLPLRFNPEDSLPFITPWGPLEAPIGEITGLRRVRQPTPAARLDLRDGTRLAALPTPREIAAHSSRFGPVTVQATDVAALWPPASEAPDTDATEEELETLADLEDHPSPRALLRGSAVIAATIASPSLALFSGGTETELSTAEVTSLERAEGGTETAPLFTITLASGATFEGALLGGTITLQTRAASAWSVPLSHFLAWKAGTAAPTP